MRIVVKSLSLKELQKIAKKNFGNLVKAVVDIQKEIMAIDAELHADQEAYLLKKGSNQKDLWGINIYPNENKKNRIEFDSVINIRPNQNNTSREIESKEIRKKIIEIIDRLVK
jgi:hypothetical protein